MSKNKIIFFLVAASVISFTYYYLFVDTLSISQLAGKKETTAAKLVTNLFDLDSGLTRYNLYHISRKADYWNRRMQEINSVKDPIERKRAKGEFQAELMQNPSIRKIMRCLAAFGAKSPENVLRVIGSFNK